VKDFLKVALADKPAVPFRVPAGIKLIRIDARSGLRASPGAEKVILEAFKPGTAPPDSASIIGYGESEGHMDDPIERRPMAIPSFGSGRGLY
ncbi:MAG: penicillin-binding protein, partial [Pseudomonadota bacterium]|nr:penicillin-binding protein [Pseudomonadota bacterium]